MREHTLQEIEAMIAGLKAVRPLVPPRDAFNGSNLDRIDAQIEVLEHQLTEGQIMRTFAADETADEFNGEQPPAYEAALEARAWLDGEPDAESLLTDWQALAGVKVQPAQRARR